MQHDCDLCSSPCVARWESCVLQVQRTLWVRIRRGVGPAMQSTLASWCHVSHFNSFQELVRIFTVLTMCTYAWVTHTLAAHPFFSLFPSRSLSLLSVAAPFFSLSFLIKKKPTSAAVSLLLWELARLNVYVPEQVSMDGCKPCLV